MSAFSKKLIIIGVAVLIVAIGAYFIIKSNNESKFIENIKDAKSEMINIAVISEHVTGEYADIWGRKIRAGYSGLWIDGETRYFSDFNEAIKYKMDKFKELNLFHKLDSISTIAKSIMGKLNNPPSKYQELHKCVMDLYIDVCEYESLAKSPEGNLNSFSQKIRDLSSGISRKMKEIDVRMPKE